MKRILTTLTALIFAFIATAQIAPYKIHNNKLYVIWQGDTLKLNINPDSSVITGNNRLNMSHDSIYFPHLATGATDTNIMFVRGSDGKMMYLRPADIGIGNSYWAKNGVLHPADTANAVAIGTNSVASGTMLRVNDGSVLFDGSTGTTPASGAGTRLMWIPAKGAIRAGVVSGTQWDVANIGINSSSFGEDCRATGYASISGGIYAYAAGTGAASFGYQSSAVGNNGAFATGNSTWPNGIASAAFNNACISNGTWSFSANLATKATGNGSAIFGGYGESKSYLSLVGGRYNIVSGTADSWVNADPLFQIGNGTGTGANSNDAFRILKNGTAYIGDASSTTDPIMTVSTTDSTTTLIGILKLTPQDDPPVSASEGMIYADTDHHLYYYNGTAWVQLD